MTPKLRSPAAALEYKTDKSLRKELHPRRNEWHGHSLKLSIGSLVALLERFSENGGGRSEIL
ncbi:hypothetical protein BELL_0526g00080 [Botrytis elliptica]|uniref:Uncharacterized protein n=1 Tax=Botrytis elliptica TaxID=278938 RepID=A0A4Z1JE23_9HELO|nr:hypothetical protein BELL_0526g00080 [Botrytis elliptica]